MRLAVLQQIALWTVLVALGAMAFGLAGLAAGLPGGRLPGALGPRTVPLFVFNAIGVGVVVVAVLEIVGALKQRFAGHAEGTTDAGGSAGPKTVSLLPVLIVLVAVVAFAAVWRTLGFLATSFALVAVLTYVLAPEGRRSLWVSGVLGITFTAATWVLFRFVLSVPLPGGTLWGF